MPGDYDSIFNDTLEFIGTFFWSILEIPEAEYVNVKDKLISKCSEELRLFLVGGEMKNYNTLFVVMYKDSGNVKLQVGIPEICDGSSEFVIIKNNGIIDYSKPVKDQLSVLTLPTNLDTEYLVSIVDNGIYPAFNMLIQSNVLPCTAESASVTKARFKELTSSFHSLKNSIPIPELTVHSKIKEIVEEGANTENYMQYLDDRALEDSNFLNVLQSMANQWHIIVLNLVGLQRDTNDDSVSEEVKFWANMEAALMGVVDQLQSTEIQIHLKILATTKRLRSSLVFVADTGITERLKQIKGYSQFVSTIPLQQLRSSSNLAELNQSLKLLASSFKKFRLSTYPVDKFIIFLQKVSQYVGNKVLELLPNVFEIEYDQFQRLNNEITICIDIWDEVLRDNNIQIREMIRKRKIENIAFVNLNSFTDQVKNILERIAVFRRQHALLSETLNSIGYEESTADLKFIYEPLTAKATNLNYVYDWPRAKLIYNQRLSTLEGKIIKVFELKLRGCQNSETMLKIFLNFKPLMKSYPKLRSIMKTHQQTLINLINQEIASIEKRSTVGNHATDFLQLRDLSPIAALATQDKQVGNHLRVLIKQLELLLGPNFKDVPEGITIVNKCDNILSKFNSEKIICQLIDNISNETEALKTPILKVLQSDNGKYELCVNFNFTFGILFKDIRNLIYMGHNIPNNVVKISKQYRIIYPQAIVLLEQIQTLMSLFKDLPTRPYTGILLKSHIDHTWLLLSEAMVTLWDCYPSKAIINQEDEKREIFLNTLEKKLNGMLNDFEKLDEIETELSHTFEVLSKPNLLISMILELILDIQRIINELPSMGFDKQDKFVALLNKSLKLILERKIKCFLKNLVLKSHTVSVTFEEGYIIFTPDLKQVKSAWLRDIEEQMLFFMDLPRFTHLSPSKNFSFLHETSREHLAEAYSKINHLFQESVDYARSWKDTEMLWSLEEITVWELIDSDIGKCLKLLTDMLEISPSTRLLQQKRCFSTLLNFQYEEALYLVFEKYNFWVNYLCNQLMSLYMKSSAAFEQELIKERKFLEESRLDVSSLENMTELVKAIDTVGESREARESLLNVLMKSEKLLYGLNWKFSSEFIFVDQLECDLKALSECSIKKEALLSKNRDLILNKLESEAQRVDKVAIHLVESWSKKKPVAIEWAPAEALSSMIVFEESYSSLKSDMQLISETAKIMLIPIVVKDRLETFYEELSALRKVWMELEGFWNKVNSFLKMDWDQLDVDTHLKILENIQLEMNTVSFKIKQYLIFENLLTSIEQVLKSADILRLLKDPSLKTRHWQYLFNQAGKKFVQRPGDISLETVLSINSKLHETIIKDLIQKAQKEFVLEKALDEIKSFWGNAHFQVVNHGSGLQLVGEWNSLQQACIDNLEELHSMKNSIHYKYFEPECLELENKLTELSVLQTEWMDTQFYWIDLYGVIGKNREMQNLLPLESSKFKGVTLEFKAFLLRIFALNNVLDVVHIPDSVLVFKRLLDSLKLIKSSLNDFLEKQRILFPKFYFLGNDDLLKFIGAGDDLDRISVYMAKMYGSIAGLNSNGEVIKGIFSAEREELNLTNAVNIRSLRCDEWLSLLDNEIKTTISADVSKCLSSLNKGIGFTEILDMHIFQVLMLSWQIFWTNAINECFKKAKFSDILALVERETEYIICEMGKRNSSLEKRKLRSLLVECLHYVDVVQRLNKTSLPNARIVWFNTQKFFYDPKQALLKRIHVSLAGRSDLYGFEYIGIPERLIYTPTLQKGYIALTEALNQKYGGCLFGPAGTGKTETVKSLGQNLGRIVMVFNCDDSYDFQAMARLMMGISQVGAWGCFDEFNRLSENIMSAVSSHVEVVQNGLASGKKNINLMGATVALHQATAFFITLNPNYAGRSKLPENLKKKFREFSIKTSDNYVIADTILKILGFRYSNELSKKVVSLFNALKSECTPQKHYDFGLRTLKKTLKNCFEITTKQDGKNEELILVESLCQIIMPTLIKSDEKKFLSCIHEMFSYEDSKKTNDIFMGPALKTCEENYLCSTEEFKKKCTQFYHLQKNQQALILAGKAGSGKTTVWRTVLKVLKNLENTENFVYTIATKTLKKEELYGSLNRATLEWQDGIFTSILRQVLNNTSKTFDNSRVWIIFDSDLDPEYAETLNSALDDNKMLTLPTGERLEIPKTMRLIFETHDLEHTTPATITRCGLILFTENVCSPYENLKGQLVSSFDVLEAHSLIPTPVINKYKMAVFKFFCPASTRFLFEEAEKLEHIMEFDRSRVVSTMTTLIIHNIQNYNSGLQTASDAAYEKFFYFKIKQVIQFSFVGDTKLADQLNFHNSIVTVYKNFHQLNIKFEDVDFEVENLELVDLDALVPQIFLEAADLMKPNIVIPTKETVKQDLLVFQLLHARKSIILCGPPGSGKTMILNNALQRSSNFQVIGLNFSKDTSIAHILKTLNHHTCYVSSSKGLVLRPKSTTKEIVLFCDEVNLPQPDAYGTQSTILFLRELIEKKGFWKPYENKWVSLERIHVVGACNPPTDPGRIPMSLRFTRHVSILFVDYPTEASLKHIYETFYRSVLRLTPRFKDYASNFSEASISLYSKCKHMFSSKCQTHYLISPRELTRWTRGFYTSVRDSLQHTLQSLLKMWAYEAWRIFADRLVQHSEKKQFQEILHETINHFFPNQPIENLNPSSLLFSRWISLDYREVNKKELFNFVQQRLQTFCEEEVETSFIIYDEMLDHLLRIDRVLRQVQGHAMLIGPSRTGKTTMAKFVAWLNGISVVQPNIHRGFTVIDFDEFLRKVLLSCSIEDKRLCLIIDESNILELSFLERMNTLLANSDIPDLFQDESYELLMSSLKNRIFSLGLLIDTEQEMYEWFVQQISRNLHVVFTMRNPYNKTLPSTTTSPALFNRCAINWMGNWSAEIMRQIADAVIRPMPLDLVITQGRNQANKDTGVSQDRENFHDAVINLFLNFNQKYFEKNLDKEASPGAFLDALKSFGLIFDHQCKESEDKQRFVRVGLDKLDESVLKVKELSKFLFEKKEQLKVKESEARKTLDKMLYEQNEAERKQEAVVEIREILGERQAEGKQRRKEVMDELNAFAPVLDEAQRGVKNIKKQQLTEIRSMINPPSAVKVTMEAVCAVLGQKISSWREIQNFIRKDEFIFDIVNFDTETMLSSNMKSFIEKEYFSKPNFTYQLVDRASKACGPLYQWVFAQLKYGEILGKAEPLRKEAQKIEDEALQSQARLLAAEDMILELQESIEVSKQNYSQIIRDIELIKTEMREVQSKLERSKTLILNLTSEKQRWAKSTQLFKKDTSELTGNCLISALYSNYCGALIEKQRKEVFDSLKSLLHMLSINFDPNYQFVTHNVEIEKRFGWTALGLPNEEFFLENFSMVLTSPRVPYILDPNSQIKSVISKYYKERFTLTSFLEAGFVKKVENAVRFGGVILIQDAEYFDPVISKLVAQEFKASGGRRTVQIGENEVDLASEFRLLLYSSDADATIPKFVEARVRLLNFSINKGSIETKSVRISLFREAPKIDEESNELMKLNGEYKILLKTLESKLLEELNDSKGNILENDKLIQTLEKLKLDSSEVENKLKETEDFMRKVNHFSNTYAPLGHHASTLYSVLELMAQLHWFYDISIWQFMECFESIFQKHTSKFDNRVEELVWNLYQEVYSTFSPSLVERHREAFKVVLYLTYCFKHKDQTFKEKTRAILEYVKSDHEEADLEALKKNCPTELLQVIQIIQNHSFKAALLEFQKPFRRQYTLEQFAIHKTGQCVLLGSERDTDASFKVLQLAEEHQQNISVIALGSSESTNYAEQEIARCSTEGGWILLQNLQMSLLWTKSVLSKRLEQTIGNGKIFMTCNILGQDLPSFLMQQSYKVVYEGTPGILDTVKDLYFNTSSQGKRKFLLCWFHSILLNRSLLAPIGFSKRYEFNDCDFTCALKFLSDLPAGQDAQEEICYMLGTIIYGGKVDEGADRIIIQQTCTQVFCELRTAVSTEAVLASEIAREVILPDTTDQETLSDFLSNLQEPSDSQSKWLGLPDEAIKNYETIQAQELASQVLIILKNGC